MSPCPHQSLSLILMAPSQFFQLKIYLCRQYPPSSTLLVNTNKLWLFRIHVNLSIFPCWLCFQLQEKHSTPKAAVHKKSKITVLMALAHFCPFICPLTHLLTGGNDFSCQGRGKMWQTRANEKKDSLVNQRKQFLRYKVSAEMSLYCCTPVTLIKKA